MAVLSSPHASGRIDWKDIRDRVDLAPVAIALLGPAPGRRGEHGRRLWWRCPFHEDGNPSFCVEPGKPSWRCFGCGEHGDAPKLVMKLDGVTFPEAVRILAGLGGIMTPVEVRGQKPLSTIRGEVSDLTSRPAKLPRPSPGRSSGLVLADALTLVSDATTRLWSAEGTEALAYLHRRGLTDETIRAARLGVVESISIPRQDGSRFNARGVVIPWFDGDRLTLVKLRRPGTTNPRYVEAFRDRPTIFPCPAAVRPGRPLIIVEGEFDCLLLAQELGEAVLTLGSASIRPDSAILGAMLAAPRWFIATDADKAGDLAASGWPPRAVRIRPPEGKDWTAFHATGFNRIRYFWGGIIKKPVPWEVLASQAWGPALGDPIWDECVSYAIEERLAIQQG